MKFNQLETKGDFITYCLNNCSYITNIDTAIPANVRALCKKAGTPTSNLVTVYYDTGEICHENIIAKACITHRNLLLKANAKS